jgi:hypothetical protein
VDYDNTVLFTETVVHGTDATVPVPPHRGGYIFTGWDTDFTNVTSNLTVKALYIATHAVAFYPGDHGTFPVTFIEFIPEGDPTPLPPWQLTGEPGWRFVGWYPELAPTVTEDTGYTAQWEPVVVSPTTYTVTFVDYDDTPLGAPQTVVEGNDATAPPDPVRSGYTFTGWDKPFTNITTDLTVKALYEPVPVVPTYSVTFDYGTHALFPILEVIDFIPEGSPTPAAPQPVAQPGWRLVGWYPALALTVTGDATYTAQWERITYTVTFVDFDDAVLLTATVAYGTDATAPVPPVRAGYTFTGWDTAFTNVTSNLTVKALYEPVPVIPTYTVTFTPGAHGTFAIFVSPGMHAGDTTPQAPQTSAESGWRFVGWLPALTPTVTGDVTYIAQWEELSHTVTFVDSDGTVLLARTVSDGASAIAPVPPMRAGYTFVGWDRTFDSVTADLTITALYTPLPTYTVTFNPGTHGTFTAQSTTGLYVGDVTPQAPQPDAESSWLFVGWLPALSATVTQDVTYTAQWEPAPAPPVTPAAHTVTFDPGTHGAFVAQITTGLSAGAVTPVAPQPAPQPGFRFIGWLPAFSPYVSGDVTYTAQWEAEGIPPDIATPTPAPTPPAPSAPPAPPTVIVNTPPAQTPSDQYIPVPAPDSGTGQTPSASTGTDSSGTGTGGSSSGTGIPGAQQGQTLPDDQAPLADGSDGTDNATGTNVLLFVLALVFLACLFGAGCLYMIRTKR